MKIVGGMRRGRIGSTSSDKLTTNIIHGVREGYVTFCGVNFEKSKILGIATEGRVEEINCKKCLKRLRNN